MKNTNQPLVISHQILAKKFRHKVYWNPVTQGFSLEIDSIKPKGLRYIPIKLM
jgi:hypothetical protein